MPKIEPFTNYIDEVQDNNQLWRCQRERPELALPLLCSQLEIDWTEGFIINEKGGTENENL